MLLAALDADEVLAAEKYGTLRYKLVNLLTWKGCSNSDADELADRVNREEERDLERLTALPPRSPKARR